MRRLPCLAASGKGRAMTAKEMRAAIIAHDKCKPGGDTYVPCQCLNCQSLRSKLFALTDKESKK